MGRVQHYPLQMQQVLRDKFDNQSGKQHHKPHISVNEYGRQRVGPSWFTKEAICSFALYWSILIMLPKLKGNWIIHSDHG